MSSSVIFTVYFVIFMGLLLLGGVLSRRWVKESSDFILAGREVSPLINIMGVCAIGYAGTSIALAPGFAVLLGFWGAMAFGGIYCLCGLALYGILYAGFIRKNGAQTLPEYLEMRYGPNVRKVVSVTSVIGMCGILANNIVSCVQAIAGYTGWNTMLVMAVVFLVIIAFTFISGLWAATINDFVQVVIGVIVVPALLCMLINKYGGTDVLGANWKDGAWMTAGVTGAKLAGAKFTYPSILNFAVCFAAALVWGNNYYWMKIASCRNEKTARASFVIAGVALVIIFFIPLSLIGSYTGAFHLSSLALGGGKVPHTGAYGFIAATFVPVLGSLFIIGAIAASISTASTAALGASAVATRDIYQRVINPKADTRQTLRASKIAMLLIGAITFLLCLFPGGPTYLFAFANCWLVPPAILVGLGALWPRFGKTGAMTGAIAGMTAMAVFTVLQLAKIFDVGQYIYLASLGFIVTLAAAVAATLAEKPAYYAAPGWERVPSANNRADVKLEDTDIKALALINIGHLYMADITDSLGADSGTSAASVERLDRGGYITRAGLSGSAFYTFEITQKGMDALPESERVTPALREAKLSPMYAELLALLKNDPEKQLEFVKKYNIKSMRMAAIASHLSRQGYVEEKGLFKRKLRITQKGIGAADTFAP